MGRNKVKRIDEQAEARAAQLEPVEWYVTLDGAMIAAVPGGGEHGLPLVIDIVSADDGFAPRE